MRTLNRPLFKMGGSIKEGVMHGIREPKRHGGKMLLVGQHPKEFQDNSGREKHVFPLLAWGASALRAAPIAYRGFKAARTFAPGTMTWGQRLKDTILGSGRFRDVTLKKPPGIKSAPWIKETIPGKRKGIWEALKDPKRFGAAIREYPVTAAMGLTLPNLASQAVVPTAKAIGSLGKTYIDMVLPGDQSKWFTKEKPKKEGKGYILPGQGLSGEKVTKDTSTAAERKAFADKQKDARLAKYLDMMGYDKARKNAVADAMIDAGRIINERGTLKGKNINRELIDPIIGATSARLDKPEQIREAVGLMMTKTDLEKEAAGGKPGPALKAARDYQEQFGGTLQNAYKHTGGTKQLNFGETKSALAKQYGKGPNDQDVILQTIQLVKGNEPGFKLDDIKVLGDAETLEGLEKQEDFISITDSVLKSPDAQTEDGVVKPGIYVVGHAVVVVTEDGKVDRIN